MGRCDKIHKDFGERISCVQCMLDAKKDYSDYALLLKNSLDDLSRKTAVKIIANHMNRFNYSEKTIKSLAEECIEKNSYGKDIHQCVRESFDILYELGYRIVKKNEGGD